MAIDPKLVETLDMARAQFGRPIVINSGTRCPKHNQEVGGALHSAHLVGPDGYSHAVDIKVLDNGIRFTLVGLFYDLGIIRMEVSNLHLHVDNALYLPYPMLKAIEFKT